MLSDAGRVRGTQDSAFGNDAVDQFRRCDIEGRIPAAASMRGNGDRAHDHTDFFGLTHFNRYEVSMGKVGVKG